MNKLIIKEKIGKLDTEYLEAHLKEDTYSIEFHHDEISEIANIPIDVFEQIVNIYYYGTLREYLAIKGKENLPQEVNVHLFFDDNEEETKFIEIPADIEEISDSCFAYCRNIITVSFLNDDTKIGGYAFYNCRNLEHVNLPKNLKIINPGTFRLCEELEHIEIPNSVRSIMTWAFSECSSLESFIIPDSLEELEDAFFGCLSLRDIDLKDKITHLASGTFDQCESLTKVVIRSNITEIERGTFSHPRLGSPNDIEVYYYGSLQSWIYLNNKEAFEEVRGVHLFLDDDEKETKEIVYTGPLYIPDYAFANCIFLKAFYIVRGITTIGKRVFKNCYNLEIMFIPDSILEFKEDVFHYCYKMKILFMGSEDEKEGFFKPFDIVSYDYDMLKIYSYSEDKPTKEGLYWHYVNNFPTIY